MPSSSEIEQIYALPEVPLELKAAARIGTVVPFIGAGVLQLAGCPGWDAFADAALKFFVDNGDISYAKFDQISRLTARVKLSLAIEFERVSLNFYDQKMLNEMLLNAGEIHRRVFMGRGNAVSPDG